MGMIEHHTRRFQAPMANPRRLLILGDERHGRRTFEAHRRPDHVLAHPGFERRDISVVRRSGDIVHDLSAISVVDVPYKAAFIAGQPVAVAGPRDEPVTIHGNLKWEFGSCYWSKPG